MVFLKPAGYDISVDPTLREKDRGYYKDRGRALGYDRRSAGERSMARYRKAAGTVGRYLSDGTVLDIGCGTARMIIEIARMLPGLSFTGIDVSDEMIRLAELNVEQAGLGQRIMLLALTAEGLGGFPDNSFDMVMSHGSVSGWLEPGATLREVERILRPGGMLYVTDWNMGAPDGLAPYLKEAEGNQEHLERIRMAFASSYTDDELRRVLVTDGLGLVEFTTEGLWMSAVLRKAERGFPSP